MPRRATKDTYAVERTSGVDIRRIVKAGDLVPEHYVMAEGEFEEVDAGERVGGAQVHAMGLPYPEANEPADKIQAESLEATRQGQDEALGAVQQEPQVTPGADKSQETNPGESVGGAESQPQRVRRGRGSAKPADEGGSSTTVAGKTQGEPSSSEE